MRRFEPEIVSLREWIAASATNFGKLRSFDIQSWQNLEGYLHQGDGRSYAWTWHTTLDPQAELTLRMSQWSSPRPDGTRVNYQGLGLRLPREFSGDIAKVEVRLDGQSVTIAGAHGERVRPPPRRTGAFQSPTPSQEVSRPGSGAQPQPALW